ncbi:pRiA4b ORF-3-like protein [Mesobacillus persicus]|uniref:PRiA4b ORF-3-like protein n=1 Tax=Mesobacillus persicus TaxID=930146 RepID=A0A1H8K6C3_9BACI|nr:plasmid pRiA4b ORF-3 family protein [Mesobacillus persicus]SEN88599.1 pRiA4b ORF-3-like protein [Mesobacillus persicus]
MLIQCTKKLLEQLDIKPVSGVEEEPLFSWHTNLIIVNRRKTLVLVNDLTRYVVVLYGVKGKDFKKIDELILEGIRETLREEGIKEEVIEKYLLSSQNVTFAKTKDRTSVARMNRACESLYFYPSDLDATNIFKPRVSRRVSRLMVGDGKNRYIHPNEEMYKNLEGLAGHPIFGSRAVQLKVTLNLEGNSAWRRIVVPLNRTFPHLHDILQFAFDWEDSHLHEFTFYEGGKPGGHSSSPHQSLGHKPVLTLVCTDEAFNYPVHHERILEMGVKLSEYLPAYQRLTYTYDLGDDWKHEIEVEKTIEEYDAPHPICLEGEGNTPPEDVGGSGGYEEFLKILADPNHPDYQHMRHWGRMQGYKEFDIEQVNRFLKRV